MVITSPVITSVSVAAKVNKSMAASVLAAPAVSSVLRLERRRPVSVTERGQVVYEYLAAFRDGSLRSWVEGRLFSGSTQGRGLVRALEGREARAVKRAAALVKLPARPREYLPDGTVLPAVKALQAQDRLRWVVINFSSERGSFTVETSAERRAKSAIDDWPLFLAALPDEECRFGVFRFDFRARRTNLLVQWSPPTSEALEFEDVKVWDMRKELLRRAEASPGLIDVKRIHLAENGPTPRESLLSLLLEMRQSEFLRRLYSRCAPGVAAFLGITPEDTVVVRGVDGVAPAIVVAQETLDREAAEAMAEVAAAEALRLEREELSTAHGYALGFAQRWHGHVRETRRKEAEKIRAADLLAREDEIRAAQKVT